MVRTYSKEVLEMVECLCGAAPAERVTVPLLRWYAAAKRELPWRDTDNPYYIWLSEIILQQTQIAQGWNYYLRFVERFPTVQDLAAAPLDAVLKLWEGLGYYSRARNLHEAAKTIVGTFGGVFPCSYDELLSLKGVGAYTASAIASIAFHVPVAAVDGNALRVAARYWGISLPVNRPQTVRLVTALLDRMIAHAAPGEFNQAVMDLGATVCKPQSPVCAECPLRSTCVAYRNETVSSLPVKEKTLVRRDRRLLFVYVMCDDGLFIRRREGRDIWRGLYEPVCIDNPEGHNVFDCPNATLRDLLTVPGAMVRQLETSVRHMLTHRTIIADFYSISLPAQSSVPASLLAGGYQWVPRKDWQQYAFPVIVRLDSL